MPVPFFQEHFGDAKAELYVDSVRAALDITKEPFMETSVIALGASSTTCQSDLSAMSSGTAELTVLAALGSWCTGNGIRSAGHIALACPVLEAECALLIAAHVARQPLQLDLARSVLEQCARQLGYPDRTAYAHMFAWSTASAWFRLGYSLQELRSVQVLLCRSWRSHLLALSDH